MNHIRNIFKQAFFWIKSFIKNPKEFFVNFILDFKKDLKAKKNFSSAHLVWCGGLPKSGTTLIEEIFDELPYVRLNHSPLRIFDVGNIDHEHGITENMFSNLPKKKYSFLKTHTHYKIHYEKILNKYNAKIIISLRDLRDMLISRYFHIMSDNKHWQYSILKNLSFEEGFIKSLTDKQKETEQKPIEYYYYWINNWIRISKDKKYLVLWYDDYIKDPVKYIQNILDYTEFKNLSAEKIEMKIRSNLEKKEPDFKKNIKKYGKSKSTFRKGIVGEWKELFTKEIEFRFNQLLPEPIEKILKEESK